MVIKVSAGSYSLVGPLVVEREGVVVSGPACAVPEGAPCDGRLPAVRPRHNAELLVQGDWPAFDIRASNVSICGVHVRVADDVDPGEGESASPLLVAGPPPGTSTRITGVRVQGSFFVASDRTGVHLRRVADSAVTANWLRTRGDSAILIDDSSRSVVGANVVVDATPTVGAIAIVGGHGILVDANAVHNTTGGAAIAVGAACSAFATSVRVTGNTVNNVAGGDGILVVSDRAEVRGNLLSGVRAPASGVGGSVRVSCGANQVQVVDNRMEGKTHAATTSTADLFLDSVGTDYRTLTVTGNCFASRSPSPVGILLLSHQPLAAPGNYWSDDKQVVVPAGNPGSVDTEPSLPSCKAPRPTLTCDAEASVSRPRHSPCP
jgi:hypothetical protein